METDISQNICSCTDIISLMKGARGRKEMIHFSCADYPVEGKFKGSGWKKLKEKILLSAIAAGYTVYSNGSLSTKGYSYDNRVFKCSHGRQFSWKRKRDIDRDINRNVYRTDRLINNQRHGIRENGKFLPRRRATVRPTNPHSVCPFKLVIGVDSSSFLLQRSKETLYIKGTNALPKDILSFLLST